jgi:hypothetical protein
MASGNTFYSFTDANGVEVIVQRLADVPEQYRAQAKHIDLSKPAITLSSSPSVNASASPCGKGTFLHFPSFMAGAGTALVLGLVGVLAFRRAHRFLALMVGVAVMAALGIGYMTYVRRQARLPGSGLACRRTYVM